MCISHLKKVEHLFICLKTIIIYIFSEISIYIFCPFFSWVLGLFILILKRLFVLKTLVFLSENKYIHLDIFEIYTIFGVRKRSSFIIFIWLFSCIPISKNENFFFPTHLRCYLYQILNFYLFVGLYVSFIFFSTGLPFYSCANTTPC